MIGLSDLDHLALDCDGVVYVGDEAVPGTRELVEEARTMGISVVFMTNDTTMSRHEIAGAIGRTGIDAAPEDVVSAAWATALWCAETGLSPVAHVGSAQLADELVAAGVEVATCMGARPGSLGDVSAIVLGSSEDVCVRDLDVALTAWTTGTPIVAGNGDRTYPGSAGPRLGCGSLAQALAHATGQAPVVVGKPEPIMFRETERLLSGDNAQPGRIALLGDSVASDVAGANRAGWLSVLLDRGEPRMHLPRGGAGDDPLEVPDLVITSPGELRP